MTEKQHHSLNLFVIIFLGIITLASTPLIFMAFLAKHLAVVSFDCNIKGLGTAMAIYMNDHNGQAPDPDKWCDELILEAEVTCLSGKGEKTENLHKSFYIIREAA